MIRFKLRPGLNQLYNISKKDFERLTLNSTPYSQIGKDHNLRNFAVCPACDNPIQLIGLYKKMKNTDNPYGKHYRRSIPGLATYNHAAYLFCPYSSHFHRAAKEDRYEEITDREIEIYNAIRNYFDLAVYIIRQETGIYFSMSFLKKMLYEFLASKGYMYPWTSLYNIPWMLLYFTRSSSLYKCRVKEDSEIFRYLQTRTDVNLISIEKMDGYYLVDKNRNFLNLCFSTILHDRHVAAVDGDLKETITLSIHSQNEGTPPREYFRILLNINEYRFPNLVSGAKYRDQTLLDLASEMMSDLQP